MALVTRSGKNEMGLKDILWFFMIYSIIGWGIEVSYHAVTMGRVVNRGFMNGPLCPVYGCGVLSVLAVVQWAGGALGFSGNVETASTPALFIIGISFATAIELVAGMMLDVLFHARWWDYSKERFNFHGYICLRFSIIWGLAIAFVLRVVHPCIRGLSDLIPEMAAWIILPVLYLIFLADLVITILSVLKLNKELAMMKELQDSILKISDGMSEVIAEGTLITLQKIEDEQDKAKEEYEQTRKEIEEKIEHIRKSIMYHKLFGMGRILLAFPEMQHRTYQDIVENLRSFTVKKQNQGDGPPGFFS